MLANKIYIYILLASITDCSEINIFQNEIQRIFLYDQYTAGIYIYIQYNQLLSLNLSNIVILYTKNIQRRVTFVFV